MPAASICSKSVYVTVCVNVSCLLYDSCQNAASVETACHHSAFSHFTARAIKLASLTSSM